jgi:hypothetical protein
METLLTWKDVDAHVTALAKSLEAAERDCVVAQRTLDDTTVNRDKIKKEYETYKAFLEQLTAL